MSNHLDLPKLAQGSGNTLEDIQVENTKLKRQVQKISFDL